MTGRGLETHTYFPSVEEGFRGEKNCAGCNERGASSLAATVLGFLFDSSSLSDGLKVTERMFRIKICGVRRLLDVEAAANAGADAIGLNFFRPSVRYLEPERAADVSSIAADFDLLRIGVFVDEPLGSLLGICDEVGLDFIQLHGHESHEDVGHLLASGLQVIRVIRLPIGRIEPQEIEDRVAPWRGMGCDFLLDADAGVQAGGAGMRLDWGAIGRWNQTFGADEQWALAGGLTPQTVARAIAASGAKAVDVASGVEQPRGVKSAERIEEFVARCGSLRR